MMKYLVSIVTNNLDPDVGIRSRIETTRTENLKTHDQMLYMAQSSKWSSDMDNNGYLGHIIRGGKHSAPPNYHGR